MVERTQKKITILVCMVGRACDLARSVGGCVPLVSGIIYPRGVVEFTTHAVPWCHNHKFNATRPYCKTVNEAILPG